MRTRLLSEKKYSAMVFAPLPPPVGGVASIAAMLKAALTEHGRILFVQPLTKRTGGGVADAARNVMNLLKLIARISRVESGGRVLYFSSSGWSFYEKCAWALVIMLCGRRPVVVMVDGLFPSFYERQGRLLRWLARCIVGAPRFTLAVQSAGWKAYYRSIFPAASIREVAAGIDTEFFKGGGEGGRSENPARPLTVLYVGWITKDKGMLDLLDAVEILAREGAEPVRVRLIGPTLGRDEYWRGEIQKRDVGGLVTLVGGLNSKEALLDEYQSGDIFVFPSHFEGFPIALLEATAAGLACIGTAIGGIPDILDGGRAGLVIPAHAPRELASALSRLLRDPPLRAALSTAAARRARETYSQAQCIESYKSLLGAA